MFSREYNNGPVLDTLIKMLAHKEISINYFNGQTRSFAIFVNLIFPCAKKSNKTIKYK